MHECMKCNEISWPEMRNTDMAWHEGKMKWNAMIRTESKWMNECMKCGDMKGKWKDLVWNSMEWNYT
jgi:hypothetical protein